MANYTAADVKRLRDLTGSGMLDCKNALADNDGDFDKAVEELRIKGAKDVGKRAERSTAQGLIAAKDGAMIEINSETDFVAKNDEFQALAAKVLDAAVAAKTSDVDVLKAATVGDKTVDELIQELSAKIGEKLVLNRVSYHEGNVASYLHKRASDLPPAVGVLVEYTGDTPEAAEAARGAAMQVAALRAKYATRDEVPEDVIASERRIAEQTAREEGKPEAALSKIVDGRLNGFFKDVVLIDQASVQESKKTVKAVLDEAGAQVVSFTRFEVGQA
ncbi:translation elongation factor Ts [Gordonia rubripertincta]|uniref:Elongation factor Ts n=1 Tax=Gordonia rubripertincta TaxID=36822 RepID=A0ABT4MUJ5_GORRU|nr:translation elongation factor Ts [Gordonia rubripertincta]MCZ4550345.1 translation elongation factor Ts [Gordonia rubripertincta]